MPATPQIFPLDWTSGPVGRPLGMGKQLVRDLSVGDSFRLLFLLRVADADLDPATLELGFVMARTSRSAPELTLSLADNPDRFGTGIDAATGRRAFWIDVQGDETSALESGSHYAAAVDLTDDTGRVLAPLEVWFDPSPSFTPGVGPALGYRPANTVLAGPASGGQGPPAFRKVVGPDLSGITTTSAAILCIPIAGGSFGELQLVGCSVSALGGVMTLTVSAPDLTPYMPKAGGTFSGAIAGPSASFSGNVTAGTFSGNLSGPASMPSASVAGNITAGTFTGAATGLTGTAASLTAGTALAVGTTKRVTHPIGGAPVSSNVAGAYDWMQRYPVALPVPTTRWRLRVSNTNALDNTFLTTPMTLSSVYFGYPAHDTSGDRRANGNFTATPTFAVAGGTVPVNGTDLITAWVTDPTLQFAAGVPRLISLAIATTNSGSGVAQCVGNAFLDATSGTSKVGNQTMSVLAFVGLLGDVRVEYECVTDAPLGLAIGDSITRGNSDGDVRALSPGTSWENWPAAASIMGRFPMANLGLDIANLDVTFTDPARRSWTRADLATTVPDFALVALGTNSLGMPFGSAATYFETIVNYLRVTLGIPRIYLCTIIPYLPGATGNFGTLTSASSISDTSISSSISIPSGTDIQIDIGRSQETVTTTGVPTGSGPYTIPVPALTIAHASGAQVIKGFEFNRQQINDWIRQVPLLCAGCIDFDKVFSPTGNPVPDMRLIETAGVHPLRGGYQQMAVLVAAIG